jgi:hypothetical protein
MELTTGLLVSSEVMTDLRAAHHAAQPGHEIGGRLLVRQRSRAGLADLVVRFEQAANRVNRPGAFDGLPFEHPPPPGYDVVDIHSHPTREPELSGGDVRWALHFGVRRLAIFAPEYSTVAIWDVAADGSTARVPVTVEGKRARAYRPRSRPGRR